MSARVAKRKPRTSSSVTHRYVLDDTARSKLLTLGGAIAAVAGNLAHLEERAKEDRALVNRLAERLDDLGPPITSLADNDARNSIREVVASLAIVQQTASANHGGLIAGHTTKLRELADRIEELERVAVVPRVASQPLAVGEAWLVVLPGACTVHRVVVEDLSERTVLVSQGKHQVRVVRDDVRWLERLR